LDGRSRTDVLRYDTPRFSGLALAISAIAGGSWDVGADYRWKSGAVTFRAQAQYNNRAATSPTLREQVSFSAAGLHDSGVNAGIAMGRSITTSTNSNPGFIDVQVGYRAKLFGVGGTNFSFNYQRTGDLSANDSNGTSIGVSVAQLFTPIGASMALTYKNYAFDTALSETSTGALKSPGFCLRLKVFGKIETGI